MRIVCLVTLATVLVLVSPAAAEDREPVSPPPDSFIAGQVAGFDDRDPAEKASAGLATCGRPRVLTAQPMPGGAGELEQLRAHGKLMSVDPMSGQPLFQHLTDYLPTGWGKIVVGDDQVDSYGDPIVNQMPGLPGWAQRDVDALRAAISDALTAVAGAPDGARGEGQRALANYLGQALIRGLAVDDLVDLDGEAISAPVAAAVIDQLSFYEALKSARAESWGYEYRPSVYGAEVVSWIEAHGGSLAEILAVEPVAGNEAVPSGCYTRGTFALGMNLLAGANVIWQATGHDDASADVPIGFRFYFYGCDDPDQNFDVRVSTNGYFSFFQQGGGAVDGVDYSNDPITSTIDPDGYVAPAWDDLWVAPAQGMPDLVAYLTTGAVGSRVFTVEWYSMSHLGPDPNDFHYFQAKLIEATGDVELHFGGGLSDPLDSCTVGIEDYTGLDGDCGPNCGAANTIATIANNYRFAPIRPANNACGFAMAGGCLAASDQPVVAAANLGATGSDISSCAYNDIHDVWYWYHAPLTTTVRFDTCASATFDTTLAVFDQCGGVEVGCNDDDIGCGSGLQSDLTVGLSGGSDYFVRVAGYDGGQGDFTVTATPSTTPLGDSCAGARNLTMGFIGFTSNNTGCLDETSCAYRDVVDEWFVWTAPATGAATATTCLPNTSFDTTLAVFGGCGGTQIACNDDWLGLCSRIDWPMQAGQPYYLRVAGYNLRYGNYQLAVVGSAFIFADGFESGDVSIWSSSSP